MLEGEDACFRRACRLRECPGFVFLDDSTGRGISYLAACPEIVVSGSASEWPRMEREIQSREGQPGAAIGWMEFDGSYRFGFYKSVGSYCHRSATWREPPPESLPPTVPHIGDLDFRSRTSRDAYIHMVERAKEYIAAGDIYQVCLAHHFEAEYRGDPFAFYSALREVSPAPFGAFLDLGGTCVASSSPECFLSITGRNILTQPIKGTRPRGATGEADAQSARDLMTSKKEIAELVMITDLERNDLGRICEFGSVRVTEMLRRLQFRQVHHLVSSVEGTLRPGVTPAEALRSCSPGGSISGAPKRRALEIIAELEPEPRRIYTGAIGIFGFQGESRFSIAIRTAEFDAGMCRFGVGSGIVADSVPAEEWMETHHKAAGLLAAGKFRR